MDVNKMMRMEFIQSRAKAKITESHNIIYTLHHLNQGKYAMIKISLTDEKRMDDHNNSIIASYSDQQREILTKQFLIKYTYR